MYGTVLHVGLHKTGTTALQNVFAEHRDVLAALDLNYPLDPGGASGHHVIACRLSRPRASAAFNGQFRPEREMFAMQSDARAARRMALPDLPRQAGRLTILSSEIFCTFDEAETAALAAFAEPVDRCVAYFRNGIGFIHACWSTKVRWGYGRDFDVFLAAAAAGKENSCITGPTRYFELLSRTFGEDRVRLRSYEAALAHPHGIAGDFLEAELGVQGSNLAAAETNPSPSAAMTELARAVAFDATDDLGRQAALGQRRFAALARSSEGRDLIAALLPVVEQAMRPVCIADVRTDEGVIGADGAILAPATSIGRKLAAWRFPIQETRPFVRLAELQERLRDAPDYGRLVEALRFAGPADPEVASGS